MNAALKTGENDKASPPPAMWTVRDDDGGVSPPVDLDSLKRMAAEGVLTATCQISSDGDNWIDASRMPELEMDWLVLVSQDSVAGPFAFAALEVLRAAGHIPEEAQVFRRQTSPASGSQSLQLVQRTIAAEKKQREAESRMHRLRGELEAKDLEFEAERQRMAAESSQLKAGALRFEADASALRNEIALLSESAAAREELETKLVDAERELAKLKAAYAELENRQFSKLRALKEEHDSKIKTLADRELKVRDLARALGALMEDSVSDAAEDRTPADEEPQPAARTGRPPRLAPKPAKPPARLVPESEIEVIPPQEVEEPGRTGKTPRPAPSAMRKAEQLAALEAQAQQELAKLKSSNISGFWSRRNTAP